MAISSGPPSWRVEASPVKSSLMNRMTRKTSLRFFLTDWPMAVKKPYFLMTDAGPWETPILPASPSLRGVTGMVSVCPPRSTEKRSSLPALFWMMPMN